MPTTGAVFFSLADRDKTVGAQAARVLVDLGFTVVATVGTAAYLTEVGVPVSQVVAKLSDDGIGVVELLADGKIQLVVNSPRGRGSRADGAYIRSAAGRHGVPLLTTASAALAAANGIAESARHTLTVRSLQEYHRGVVA
jgi:carbamoyl-phosphate synthase large subunit